MFKKRYKKGQALLDEIQNTPMDTEELYCWYIGQCGYILRKEVTVYIDPVLNDLTDETGNSRRYYPVPFAPEQVRANYVLCTHAHADHMALPTVCGIAKANPDTRFIVPGDCIPYMLKAGIDGASIIEARAKELLDLPGLKVLPIAAAHPVHQKTPNGGDTALSYLLDMNGSRVLHMGDTYLTDPLYTDLKANCMAPDLFITPINGGDYFRTARDCIGNLSAIESARLAVELSAGITLPSHYDMVMDNTVDPCDFIHELMKLDTSARFALPALGERILYRK